MLALNSQRTSFNVVISDINRCKNDITTICDNLSNSGLIYYLILHDKDADLQGKPKLNHLHIIICSMKRLRCKQVIGMFMDICETNVENIQVDEVLNIIGCVQYLIHLNDLNKYQYEVKDIHTNNESNLQAYLLETPKTNELTTAQLLQYILYDKISRIDLINAIGIGKYQHYRQTINDLYDYQNRYK